MTNEQVEMKKAFSILSSLLKNLPDDSIEEKYAILFHTEIDRLIKLGFSDLEEFKIPVEEITHRVTSWSYAGGENTYSKDKYVDREIFLIKLEAILSYFKIASPKVEIGFKG